MKKKIILQIFIGIFLTLINHPGFTQDNLQQGLIEYYPLDGNALDFSGFSRHGVLSGNYNFAPGKFGQSLHVTGECGSSYFCTYGNGGHIIIPPLSFSSLPAFTLSIWVKEESMLHPDGEGYLFFGAHFSQDVSIGHFGNSMSFKAGSSGVTVDYSTNYLNQWVLYTFTVQNSILKAYINESLVGTTTIAGINLSSDSAGIGKHWWYLESTRFTGYFDEVRIYDRALSNAEIANSYIRLNPPSVTSGASCGPGSVTFMASGATGAAQYKWYASPTSATVINTGPNYTTPILTHDSTFYVAIDSAGFQSARVAAIAYVHALPVNIGQSTGLLTSLQTGMVAYYPFNGNANDESGNSHTGVVHGATLTTDRCGIANSAYSFNGVSNWIEVQNDIALNFGTTIDFTYSFWIKYNNSLSISGIVGKENTEPLASGCQIMLISNKARMDFMTSSPTQIDFLSNTTLNNDIWHFVVFTAKRNTNQCRFYVDGLIDSTLTNSNLSLGNVTNSSSLKIGVERMFYNYFNGKLDDIRIYNRALTQEEVVSLYAGSCDVLTAGLSSDSICSGSNTSLSIQNSQSGVSYQLISSGTNYGSPQVGNGDTLTFAINGLMQTTSFTILATDTATNCSVALDSTFTVYINPLPNNIGQSTALSSLQNGLVAYYPFNGNADDESGNGHNGVVNGAILTSDRCGNENSAYDFNGTSNYIANTDTLFDNGWQGFTISSWFNSNNISSLHQCLFNTTPHNGTDIQFNYFSNNKVSFFLNSNPGIVNWDISWNQCGNYSSYVNNTWYHYVFVKNGTNYKLYLNGILDADFNSSITPISFKCGIIFGSIDPNVSSAEYFSGKIDDIRIYNRAFTATEVTELYLENCNQLTIELESDSICSGTNTSLAIQNSQSGVSYQLISGGANYGSPQVGNGDTLTFAINGLTQTTSFTILATDTATNCSITLDSTFTVYVGSTINAIVSPNITICSGSSTILTASGGTSYLWSNGMTSDTITVSPTITTVYQVTVSDAFGCSDVDSVRVTVNPSLTVGVSLTASANPVCEGDTVHYTAHMINAGTNATLQWYVNGVLLSNSNITDGLIAYYPFDGNALDYSGNNNHAAVVTATPTSDRFGNANSAYNFAGITNPQIIRVPNSPSLQLTNQATFSLWVCMNSYYGMNGHGQTVTNGYHATFSKDFDQCCLYEAVSGLPNGEFMAYGFTNGWGSGINLNDTVPGSSVGQWYNLTFVLTPTQAKIYSNGQLIIAKSGTNSFTNANTKDLYFGRFNSFWYPLNGKLDDVKFYNRALSDAEALQLYQGADSTFSYVPQNGDIVTCVLTANGPCLINNPATSNAIVMSVTPILPVSVTLTATENPVCSGTTVTYTATPTNGGTTPAYQWKVNGTNAGTNSSLFSYIPDNNDTITCVLTSSISSCTAGNPATSDSIVMTVNPSFPVSVLIVSSVDTVCSGTPVSYNATTTNGGAVPFFQWKVNGINVGGNDSIYAFIPANNDIVTCVLTSSLSLCPAGNPATSNSITMTVNPILPVSVLIGSSANPVCSGAIVVYTATPANGGATPAYQWKVNGTNVGTNSSAYSYIPANNDVVSCELTSSVSSCITGNPAASNIISMTVNPNMPVSILIGSSANPVCSGTAVTYTATSANGGTTPAYQWKVNGTNAGINSSSYSFIPTNNDVVTCILTSSISSCATGNPATSNGISMIVNPNIPVSVLIGSSANPVCSGTSVTYTATPTNGGTTPVYQWKVNGTNVGTNSSTYSNIPLNYDVISCVLTSSISTCATGTPATSNILAMTVNPNLAVSVSIGSSANPVCSGTTVTFTATPTNGGTTPDFQWKVNGNNAGTNTSVFSYIPANNDVVSCALISSISLCAIGNPATSNSISMIVNPNLPVSILIGSSANPVCAGTSVSYTATPANGGMIPVYQWKVNGTNVGANSSGYSYIPANNDLITCALISSISACATGNPATSNSVKMAVNAIPVPVIAGPTQICNHSSGVVYTAQAGMTAYLWTVTSGGAITAGAGTSSITVDWNVAGNQSVRVSYTNANNCNSLVSNFATLVDVCPADLSVVKIATNMHPLFGNNIDFVVTATNDGPYNATKAVVEDILQSGYTYISSSATRGTYDPASGIWLLGNLAIGSSGSLTVTVKVNSDGNYMNTSAISGFEADENMANNISSIEPIPTDLFIPEGFSPNDDGINDILVIRGISNFPNNTFVVYNRWGNKVFEAGPYNDTWDGISTVGIKAGGDKLPAGTYFYLFTPGDGSEVMKGSFYLNK